MLDLKNISKTFNPGTVNEKVALENVNLHLDDGDFATIVGSNGAGKSTLFNAIAGEFIADTGTITLDGRDITFLPDFKRSKAIGRMFQDPLRGTAPHMTIEENLALAFLRASGHTSALLVCMILKGQMKSVRKGVDANVYTTAGGGLKLTDSYDHYTHTTETRRKIESDSGGGGRSSGGTVSRSGGGGHGRSGKF